jgi:hypothetical protein
MAGGARVNWRIYRLPGSKEQWLIDHGPGSMVLVCKKWVSNGVVASVNGNPAATPRAWIHLKGTLFLSDGVAEFVQ